MSGHGLLGLVKMERPGGLCAPSPLCKVGRETLCKGANRQALNDVHRWSQLGRHLNEMFKSGSLEISEFYVSSYGCGSYMTIPISM